MQLQCKLQCVTCASALARLNWLWLVKIARMSKVLFLILAQRGTCFITYSPTVPQPSACNQPQCRRLGSNSGQRKARGQPAVQYNVLGKCKAATNAQNRSCSHLGTLRAQSKGQSMPNWAGRACLICLKQPSGSRFGTCARNSCDLKTQCS